MSEENDRLYSDHSYDGIQEYDNPLPFWWLATFFLTIIFGFNYWLYYQFGEVPTQRQSVEAELAQLKKLQPQQNGTRDSEEELAKLASSAGVKAQGKEIFAAKCQACHGPELQGLIGPNLVDDYWIHGKGTLPDIASIIRTGVPDKGMPTWESQLKDDEIRAVAVYVAAQRGTTPPNPKTPQGEKIVRN
jgi:cytochrome c oxidase cbb3-type subunit 3